MYHITKIKDGNTPLLFFNGYGAPSENIPAICKHKAFAKYCIYYFNINTKQPSKNQLKNALAQIHEFLVTENIQEFSVLGYSVGGRMALQLAHNYPKALQDLILVAPDGIQPNFWFSLVTNLVGMQIIPQRLFSNLANSIWMDPILRIALHSKKAAEWVKSEIQAEGFTETFYATWVLNHNNLLRKNELKQVFEQTNSTLVLGSFDSVLPPKKYNLVKPWCKNYVLTTGSHAMPSILKNWKI